MLSDKIYVGDAKMNILKRDELIKMMDGEFVKGFVLIKSYSKQPTKNGGSFLGGTLEACGSMQFKIWSNGDCFNDMDKYDYQNNICFVSGKVNVFGGAYSLIIETCRAVEEGTEGLYKKDFYEEKYSAEAYWLNLSKTVCSNISESGQKVFDAIFTDELKERFCEEFAAIGHHDNCRSGLLAHTAKVSKICTVIKVYPEIMTRVGKDLLFIAAAVHDIGKVREYDNGVISEEGKRISHNISGILMLEENKEEIIKLKDEQFYTDLVSVVATHHGEYGERPRTVIAYVIHLIDCLESNLASINQQLEVCEGGIQIVVEGMRLV